jgi:hypothetical protein
MLVKRASDLAELSVGFVGGYIDYAAVSAFGAGTEVRCKTWYNQSQVLSVQNSVQSSWNNMPIIYDGGAFSSNGIRTYTNGFMSIQDYSGVQLLDFPITFYTNTTHDSSITGYIFSKSLSGLASMQYGVYNASGALNIVFENASKASAITAGLQTYKCIADWVNTGANQILVNLNNIASSGTYNGTLTNRPNFFIGCRSNSADGLTQSAFFLGYIKSVLVFNTNQYSNYNNFVAGGI